MNVLFVFAETEAERSWLCDLIFPHPFTHSREKKCTCRWRDALNSTFAKPLQNQPPKPHAHEARRIRHGAAALLTGASAPAASAGSAACSQTQASPWMPRQGTQVRGPDVVLCFFGVLPVFLVWGCCFRVCRCVFFLFCLLWCSFKTTHFKGSLLRETPN